MAKIRLHRVRAYLKIQVKVLQYCHIVIMVKADAYLHGVPKLAPLLPLLLQTCLIKFVVYVFQ